MINNVVLVSDVQQSDSLLVSFMSCESLKKLKEQESETQRIYNPSK